MNHSVAGAGVSRDRSAQGAVLLVADMRSPHAQSWIPYLKLRFKQVIVLSSASIEEGPATERPDPVSVAVSTMAPLVRGFGSDTVRGGAVHWAAVQLRHALGYGRAHLLARRIREIAQTHPIAHVHALRIPWEGTAVAFAALPTPWTVSLWGSDLTTQAPQSRLLNALTKRVLQSADGLTADCRRDIDLARHLGFSGPVSVVAGGLGIPEVSYRWQAPTKGQPLRVVCPRGLLPHVRWKELILAADTLREEGRAVELTFSDVRGRPPRIAAPHVTFLPRLSKDAMLAVARDADVVASPCTSDGIPNSVLEFMSQGCVPLMGDLASSRELIDDGVNGYLCDSLQPDSIADALRNATGAKTRQAMMAVNDDLLRRKYSQTAVYARLDKFFSEVRGDRK